MKTTKRRKVSDCIHHFVSGFDGTGRCGMFNTFNICGEEVRVHFTRDCKGVCEDWEKNKKKGDKK